MQNISIHESVVVHLMDKLEISSLDDIAVIESFVISLCSDVLNADGYQPSAPADIRSTTNRAEKDAGMWRYLTHQFIAGASVYSCEPKARVAEVYLHVFRTYL